MSIESYNNQSKANEIGGEFWTESYKISAPEGEMPLWLTNYGNVVLTSSGRGAISFILDQIKPKNKRALLPSYICDAVMLPFYKYGYEIMYYDVDERLRPVNIEIEDFDLGVFLHMGYFGFPTNKKSSDIIARFRSRSVVIIEDVTHTLFSKYQNPMDNDFVIGSIRKWFGVPSGGFLASKKNINKELPQPPREIIDLRISSLKKKRDYIEVLNKPLKDDYLEGFREAEAILDEDVNSYRIDRMSEMIIRGIDINHIKKVRRSNFEFLLENLKEVTGLKVIFKTIANDVTPMFFPVYVNNNREKLRTALIARAIYCPVHWPIPGHLEGRVSDRTKYIYDSILSIPCDQRYDTRDMKRIINAIKELV